MPKAKKGQQMPLCAYGAACTRKDCIYRHPNKTKATKKKGQQIAVAKSEQVCLPYLAGACPYGKYCRDLHPEDPEEIERITATFRGRRCRFGADCRTPGCLYEHPELQCLPVKAEVECSPPATPEAHVSSSLTEWQAGPGAPLSASAQDFAPAAHAGLSGSSASAHLLRTPPPPLAHRIGVAGAEEAMATMSLGATTTSAPMPPSLFPRQAQSHEARRLVEQVPTALWTGEVSRDASAFSISDPIARFQAVNEPRRTGVLDLHFQSTRTAIQVLDELLETELQTVSNLVEQRRARPVRGRRGAAYPSDQAHGLVGKEDRAIVWVITGTGHHTGKSHVKAGALFEAVDSYLEELGFQYVYGKDGAGKRGAFGVLPFL